jgi:hypothetical protein
MVVYATVNSIRVWRSFVLASGLRRIKELCSKAATANESEVPALFELKTLLAEQSEFVRYLAAKTLNRVNKALF